jgi:hypothetical protein
MYEVDNWKAMNASSGMSLMSMRYAIPLLQDHAAHYWNSFRCIHGEIHTLMLTLMSLLPVGTTTLHPTMSMAG